MNIDLSDVGKFKVVVTDIDIIVNDYVGVLEHWKSSVGEYWKEYNVRGVVTHFKDSDGFEEWSKYDSIGNKIYNKAVEEYWCDAGGSRITEEEYTTLYG